MVVDGVSDYQMQHYLVRIANLCSKNASAKRSQAGGRDDGRPTFCSPNTSSKVSVSRANSFPWCIKRCCSLVGFDSKAFRIFCLSWSIVVEGGRLGKLRGAFTLREGETMEMLMESSSAGEAEAEGDEGFS